MLFLRLRASCDTHPGLLATQSAHQDTLLRAGQALKSPKSPTARASQYIKEQLLLTAGRQSSPSRPPNPPPLPTCSSTTQKHSRTSHADDALGSTGSCVAKRTKSECNDTA